MNFIGIFKIIPNKELNGIFYKKNMLQFLPIAASTITKITNFHLDRITTE